jgi:chemotaxis protein methyltransferase CheR
MLDDIDFAFLRELAARESGLQLERDKDYFLDTRLAAIKHREGCPKLSALVSKLRAPAAHRLQAEVIEALANHETSFFRDLPAFELLRRRVIPELIDRRREQRRLVVWSAAVSTGQEIYSVAMMLEDFFPQLVGWDVELLGTDFSHDALARATEGRYTQFEVNRGLPASMLVKYFVNIGDAWHMKSGIVGKVRFRPLNLLRDPMPEYADIVLLRNLLIYWSPETRSRVLDRLRAVLPDDGALILGAAETYLDSGLDVVRDHGAQFLRRGAL